jgi:negative regulator of flagellin synthesis FlgM
MKIWGGIPKIDGVYDKQKNYGRVDKTSAVSGKKDVVSISNQAKDFQTIMKTLKDVPDLRKDKVDELDKKYQAGSYSVNGSDIAGKILKSVLDKKV